MSFEMVKACVFCSALVQDPKAEKTLVWSCFLILTSGPIHTYPEIFVSTNFFMRIHLASSHVCRIRSVYPEISVYALQSGNFCIHCVSGYVRKLLYVHFCICCRHSIRTSLFLCEIFQNALLTNPLRCPDTNWIHVVVVYTRCGRRYFFIRIKKFTDTKISGYVWTGPQSDVLYCR